MQIHRLLAVSAAFLAVAAQAQTPPKKFAQPATVRELIASSQPGDWRTLDPEHTLYLELSNGRVVIELAPQFAPRHVANIEKLARAHWYDGLAFVRVQDNFVAQWGDPLNSTPEVGEKRLPAEFTRSAAALPFTRLKDPDTFAPAVGFVSGFPAARLLNITALASTSISRTTRLKAMKPSRWLSPSPARPSR